MLVCVAVHPDGLSCHLPRASVDSNWCSLHEEQQAKTLKAYKRYSGALAAFDDEQLCDTVSAIEKCTTLQLLIDWQSAAREKWALADRVIDARVKHHQRFYRGGDRNHHIFIDTLEATKKELEQQMTLLDARAYKLVLEKQEASWLLVDEDRRGVCEEEVVTEPTPLSVHVISKNNRSQSTTSADSSDSSSSSASTTPTDLDPTDLAKPSDLPSPPLTERETILARLHSHFGICHCDVGMREDRNRVVEHLFRFVICRSPNLFIRAHAYDSPQAMLDVGELTMSELRTLDKALRFDSAGMLGPHVLRCAVMAINRVPSRREEDRVELLGGYWWRRAPKRAMTLDEWSHFHSFIGCNGCALKVTRTFDEWLLCRTESHSTGRLPRYRDPTTPSDELDMTFAKLGILVGRFSADAKRSLERIQPQSRKLKPVYVERDTRCWLYLRMSRSDVARADLAIAALAADKRFELLLPSDTTSKPWTTRLRTGNTPAARRAARWTDDRHFCSPAAFDVLRGDRFVDESLDVVVLSRSGGSDEKLGDFAKAVVKVCEMALV